VKVALPQTSEIHWRWLHYRVSDHIIIDLWRYGVIVLAFYAIGAGIWYFYKQHHVKSRTRTSAVIVNEMVSLLIVLQEAEQIGKPMLVWRLPYQTALIIAVWYSIQVSRRARKQGVPW